MPCFAASKFDFNGLDRRVPFCCDKSIKLSWCALPGCETVRIDRDAASMTLHDIDIPRDRIAEFCRRHRIHKLSLFGSILRDDFTPDSDIDVLVEFQPGCTPGLAFFGMQDELTKMLGHKVDLQTPGFLSKYFREEVLEGAEAVYVAA
jgi:predicted nucleotidyltransferase